MKTKTIKQVLRKKIDQWLESIEDEELRERARANTVVMGGCIASMLLREKPNDYDVYFTDFGTARDIARYYAAKFVKLDNTGIRIPIAVEADEDSKRVSVVVESAGVATEESNGKEYHFFEGRADGEAGEYVSEIMGGEDPELLGEIQDIAEEESESAKSVEAGKSYRPVFLSTNAISLSDKIQIVLRFIGSPEEILKNYDYVHCTNYWTSKDSALVLNQPALEALLSKELRYVGSLYPICSIFRMRKFINRGWTINTGQILKMPKRS